MTSAHSTTIQIVRRLAGTGLAAALALGATATASAEPVWDLGEYDKCIENYQGPPEKFQEHEVTCCINSGGDWTIAQGCVAPIPQAQNVPGEPVPTTSPPVLQNPPAGGGNPLIPTPRGSSGSTIG